MAGLWQRDHQSIAGLQKLRFHPLALVGGRGCEVLADDGRWLLDMTAAWGAASLGYAHPAIGTAVAVALASPAGASILSATHRGAVGLAETLIASLPEIPDARVWFGHSGSDANETACRAIAAATGRPGVIAFHGAYHGGTTGSMAISGHSVQSHARRADGLMQLTYPNPFCPTDDADRVIAELEHRLQWDAQPQSIGAMFFEPILSDGGLIVPPPGFLAQITDICRRHGILIVADEVKVGLGRSGLLHCFRHEGVTPDLVCLGKGLGGGLPISALVGPAAILDHATAFAMQTLHGNPACVAAATAVLDTIRADRLTENAAQVGATFKAGLEALKHRHPMIADVRGRGLVLGVEIQDADGAPSKTLTAKAVLRAFELGLVLHYVGLNSNVLELTPPLILSAAEATRALDLLDQVFRDVARGLVSDEAIAPFAGW